MFLLNNGYNLMISARFCSSLILIALLVLFSSGCSVVSVAGSVVSTAADVAVGAAKATGKAVGKAVDVVTPD